MYDKKDKRRLYWLIDEYLSGKIDEPTFCDEFYYTYNLEMDNKLLNDSERKVFSELSKVTSRFSQYDEDHKLDARAFATVQELKLKIIETKEKLKN